MPGFSWKFRRLVAAKLNYSCIVDGCIIIVYTNCTFSCLLVSGRAWASPTLVSWRVNFSYICHILYVCLDCNLTTAHRVQESNIFVQQTIFQHKQYSEQRCLVKVAWTFTVRELQVAKTNMATYKTQKVTDRWIAVTLWRLSCLCKNYVWQALQCIQSQQRSAASYFTLTFH